MTVRIERRGLSAAEHGQLRKSLPWLVLRVALAIAFRYVLFFLLMLGAGLSLAAVVQAVADDLAPGMFEGTPSPWLLWAFVTVFWGSIFLLPAYVAGRKLMREVWWHRARQRDLAGGAAEVFHVDAARYVVAMDAGDPVLLFYAGPRHTLVIACDRVLHDRELFGLPPLVDEDYGDDEGEDANEGKHGFGESPEHDSDRFGFSTWTEGFTPFPASAFELHRLPHTGTMLRIKVTGGPVAPEPLEAADLPGLSRCRRYRRRLEQETLLLETGIDELVSPA